MPLTKSILTLLFIGSLLVALFLIYGRGTWVPMYQKVVGKETVASVISKYSTKAEERLLPYFEEAGVSYPPRRFTLLALKDEKRVELWAEDGNGHKRIKSYRVHAASGVAGPKLREGDEQVPEGIYKIIGLNPNSSYHLSMKLNYPNEFDLEHANREGRTSPGSNIFIHGKAVSIGCLAMGDRTIEELFTLTYRVGAKNAKVVIAPSDPRESELVLPENTELNWIPELYQAITNEFKQYQTL